MKESAFSFDNFSVEMGDFEVRKVRKYDRIWRIGHGGSISSGITVGNGKIYFGCRNHFFYALDANSGELVWKFQASDQISGASAPVLRNDALYFGSYDFNFYAVDAGTGRMLWKFKTEGVIACGACADDERVYFGSRDNFVYALDLKTGRLVWKFKTRDGIASVPAVDGGRLFIGSFDQNFYCLEAKTGRLIWKFPTQGEVFNYTEFLVNNDIVYFGSFDNFLRAVDAGTGRLIWKFQAGTYGISAGPVLYKDVIYQGGRDGNLYALSLDGKLLWKFATREIVVPVICHDDRIYFGSGDQNLYCLDLNGRELWRFQTQGTIVGKPAIYDGEIIFGSYDCNLYAINIKTRELAWKFTSGGQPSYFPPPFESFEVRIRIPKEPVAEEKKKTYDLNLAEDAGEIGGAYKSRVTYQISTQYREKGKYQTTDSDGL